jgi:plastocyanin
MSTFALVLAGLLSITSVVGAATRDVSVGVGGANNFVDAQSGNSISNIRVGDTIQWTWISGFHSTTSGSCSANCTSDGLWDSGEQPTPFTYSRVFSTAGTFPYYCTVHDAAMQGTVIVSAPPPPVPATSRLAAGILIAILAAGGALLAARSS